MSEKPEFCIGSLGQNWLLNELTKGEGKFADRILRMQEQMGLKQPECDSAMWYMDLMERSRADVYRTVFKNLRHMMVDKLKDYSNQERLKKLSAVVVKYMSVAEMSQIGSCVIERGVALKCAHPTALRTLSMPGNQLVLNQLSERVKREVWETNRDMFIEEVKPSLCSIERQLRCMTCLKTDLRPWRNQCPELRHVIDTIGQSPLLYHTCVHHIRHRFILSIDTHLQPFWSATRCQLALAIEEDGHAGVFNERDSSSWRMIQMCEQIQRGEHMWAQNSFLSTIGASLEKMRIVPQNSSVFDVSMGFRAIWGCWLFELSFVLCNPFTLHILTLFIIQSRKDILHSILHRNNDIFNQTNAINLIQIGLLINDIYYKLPDKTVLLLTKQVKQDNKDSNLLLDVSTPVEAKTKTKLNVSPRGVGGANVSPLLPPPVLPLLGGGII
eukprot:GHVL01024106.1.p1 GENE.GHVL01024106.1~~GHVL01024106.1.p1  ORF type:complete len:441 (+),score=76.36 GHVL01024106.1:52-1374(+)